jgi:uncharacterized protein YggT (Ycf19 family)
MLILIDALRLLELAIVIRVFMTWVTVYPGDPRFSWFIGPMDKLLKPFRVVFPIGRAMMDLGPMLAIILLQVIISILGHLASRL